MSESEVPVSPQNIQDYRSREESLLREEVEEQQKFSLSLFDLSEKPKNLSDLYFYAPVKGMITSRFDAGIKHYGIDLVPTDNLWVNAALDGTVLFADYTAETGYVIQILHSNELVSIYKHNQELLKKAGDIVRAGEVIAIAGNSGEMTTGPHLHFELWYKGKPINPEDYIIFN